MPLPHAIDDPTLLLAQVDPAALRRYITIFVATCSLLGLFMFIVALVSFLRRRTARLPAPRIDGGGRDSSRLPDAWSEAGRRAAGFDAASQADDSSDGHDSDDAEEQSDDQDAEEDEDDEGDDHHDGDDRDAEDLDEDDDRDGVDDRDRPGEPRR